MILSILPRCTGRALVFGSACWLALSAIPDVHGQRVVVTGEGEILDPELCSPQIHRGGNYQEGTTRLMGKCERSVYPPVIKGEPGARYLEFSTAGEEISGNDRVELAYGPYFPFGETTYVGFQMRIPADSAVTNAMFYPLQFWQCSPLSPIAGIRVDRGSSHGINFMTRHNNTGGASRHRFTMEKDEWHSFVIAINPDPGGNGLFRVWIDGEDQGAWTGAFGSDQPGACSGTDGLPRQEYRLKFGIYKGNEPKIFKTHFTHLRVGSSYEEVVPPEISPVPTTDIALSVAQDAYISGFDDDLDSNFGDNVTLRIGQSGNTHGGQKAYFLFDATGLPEIRSIDDFEFIRQVGTIARTVYLVAILGDDVDTWTEDGITWNNAPGNNVGPRSRDFAAYPGEEIIFIGTASTGGVDPGDALRIGFDGLSEPNKLRILNALNEGSRTITFGLRYNSSQDSVVIFRSRENEDGEYAPRLNLLIDEEPSEPEISFADWAVSFDLPAGQDGPEDNPAGDGIVNGLKFALGLNPNQPLRGGLPVEVIEEIDGEQYLTLSFDRPTNVSGVTYNVDASGNLAEWPDAAVELPNPVVNGDGTERVTFRDVQPIGASERRFLRLRVELD